MHVVHTLSELEIEAYFGGGAPVRDAEVTVYDKSGNLYLEGATDEEGKFRFPPKIGMEAVIHKGYSRLWIFNRNCRFRNGICVLEAE
jgi:uncharacterized protein YfaS (alpha-2-macroglobulin family)